MAKYKVLKSVAHNLGHSFLSDMNTQDRYETFIPQHLFRIAQASAEPTVSIDFMACTASPRPFARSDVLAAVAHYGHWLPDLAESQGASREVISAATLTLNFDLKRAAGDKSRRPTFVCEVEILDDRGRSHRAGPTNWWSDPVGGL